MRKLLVTLVVLAALLLALDRVAVVVASRQLASKVQQSQGLSERPGVAIRGFPFLTQVVSGRYDRVELSARGVVRDGVRIDTVRLQADGVRVALGEALRGEVRQVPVDRGTGSALLSFEDLNALSRRYSGGTVSFSSAGGSRLRLSAQVSVLGVTTAVSAEAATVRVADGRLQVTPAPAALDALPVPVRGRARELLTVSFPLPSLPFGLRITGGEITPEGLTAAAAGDRIVFPVTAPAAGSS